MSAQHLVTPPALSLRTAALQSWRALRFFNYYRLTLAVLLLVLGARIPKYIHSLEGAGKRRSWVTTCAAGALVTRR